MPSLKAIRAKTDQVKVGWGEETVLITWRPGLLTMNFYEELATLGSAARELGDAAKQSFSLLRAKLAELIEAWDLTEDDAPDSKMVPITAETFGALPDGLTLAILDTLMEEGGAGKALKSSGAGADQKEPLEPRQGGRGSFE